MKIMSNRFESIRRVAMSLVAALMCSAAMIAVAVPVLPIA